MHALLDLRRELARRRQDQAADRDLCRVRRAAALRDRRCSIGSTEAGGLAGAGLGAGKQVGAGQAHHRDGLRLDRRRRVVAVLVDGAQQELGEAEIGEFHRGIAQVGPSLGIGRQSQAWGWGSAGRAGVGIDRSKRLDQRCVRHCTCARWTIRARVTRDYHSRNFPPRGLRGMGDSTTVGDWRPSWPPDVSGYSRLMACDEPGTVTASTPRARSSRAASRSAGAGSSTWPATPVLARCSETAAARVGAAMAVQAEIARRTAGQAEDCRMRFRIGVHLGDVIEKTTARSTATA